MAIFNSNVKLPEGNIHIFSHTLGEASPKFTSRPCHNSWGRLLFPLKMDDFQVKEFIGRVTINNSRVIIGGLTSKDMGTLWG